MQVKLKFNALTFFNYIVLFLLFLSAIDLFNEHQVLIYVAFIMFAITPGRRISFDFGFFALLLFSFSLLIFDPYFQSSFGNISRAFNYPMGYLMGRCIFISHADDSLGLPIIEKNAKKIIYVFAIGTFAHYCLNMIVNINAENRVVTEFWSGKVLSATGQAAFACLMVGVIAATLFSSPGKKKKIFAFLALILVIIYNLVLSGRTLFALIIISLFVAYVYKSRATKTGMIKTIAVLLLIVSFVLLIYNLNLFDIKTTFESSDFYERFFSSQYSQDISSDTRLQHKGYYLSHFFDSMLGGENLRNAHGQYAHDLYLDTYDEAGIFALIFIVVYIISSLSRLVSLLKNKLISIDTKQLFLCTFLIYHTMFFLEPIIRGLPWLLFSFCFTDGALSHILKNASKKPNPEKGILNENC